MSIIGIVCNKKSVIHTLKNQFTNSICIDSNIETYEDSKNYLIKICEENIFQFINVTFETIICTNNFDYKNNKENLNILLQHARYIIVNSDHTEQIETLENITSYVITYGRNLKASITISSIDTIDNTIIVCIQRNITTINHSTIEPCEFALHINANIHINDTIFYDILSETSLLLLYNKIFFKY